MGDYQLIENKLLAFSKKYYTNLLIRGIIIFLAVGLLYLLVTVGLEYFLWLGKIARAVIFWSFITIETGLMIFWIGIPLTKLFKLSKGLDDFDAAQIIGAHFPEVRDKLKNLVQLKNDDVKSELLLASIQQKSQELKPIPFTSAVNYKGNIRYLRLLIFPVIILFFIVLAGKIDSFSESFSRLSHYKTEYLPPAPFRFLIENESLSLKENEDFILRVKTIGNIAPETAKIQYNGQDFFLKYIAPGSFEYHFKNVEKPINFRLFSNDVSSEEFDLNLIKVPKLLNFEMYLDYPSYTQQTDQRIKGTGNALIPEGTKVRWEFSTRNAEEININTLDSTYTLKAAVVTTSFSKTLKSNLPYSISVSNAEVKNFETLEYEIHIVKDQYPKISLQTKQDSIRQDVQYFKGEVSDDYGLSKLELVYYPVASEDSLKTVDISISRETFDAFHFTFPGNLDLQRGTSYNFFFRIFDNDKINGRKSVKSETFGFRKKTRTEEEQDRLEQQSNTIENLGKTMEDFEKANEELEEISKSQKENQNLDYNDKKRLEDFLKRQKQQNELMKSYSEKLEKSLEKMDGEDRRPMAEELQKRLQSNEKRLEENEELLKELEEYSDKIQREELAKKLDELSKQNKSQKRSLEQLLELTKRYYVEEKKQKLAREVQQLGEKQERLSEAEQENTPENQKELNEDFNEFQDEMDELEKENDNLKKPTDLSREPVDEKSIEKNQKEAIEDLKNSKEKKAKEKQSKAGQEMKKMAQKMQENGAQMDMEQMVEDVDMLRQILENLVTFSFEQENVLKDFKKIDQSSPKFTKGLKAQSNLRENFKHIDDSLYSLALRNPKITDKITDNLVNIEFDIEKALERLAENQIPQGTASQQYVVTSANNLAYLLNQVLSSMQEMLNPGSGNGEDIQLPDIIKKQKELMKELEQGQKDAGGKPKSGQTGAKDEGETEKESEELFEIYKNQQMLRMQMQKLLDAQEGAKKGNNLTNEMKEIEDELLDKGMDGSILEKMKNLNYELMKFQEAKEIQGKDMKRESNTGQQDYRNSLQDQIIKAKEYFNSTEILNRQSLPLRPIYREKIKKYFGNRED